MSVRVFADGASLRPSDSMGAGGTSGVEYFSIATVRFGFVSTGDAAGTAMSLSGSLFVFISVEAQPEPMARTPALNNVSNV